MGRRSFISGSVRLGALAVLVSACGDAGALNGPELTQPLTLSLADYPALAQAGGVAQLVGVSPPTAVSNLGGGFFAALVLVCPHQGGRVQWNNPAFVCQLHGARFDSGGQWIGGQRSAGLRHYPTTYDPVAGTLTILPPA